MIVLAGFLVVVASVCLGYLMEGGVFSVLMQPSEWVIILGAALGAMLISSTRNSLGLIARGLPRALAPAHLGREDYLETLICLSRLFGKARREGLMSIENDIERPEASPVFSQAKRLVRDKRQCGAIAREAGNKVHGMSERWLLVKLFERDKKIADALVNGKQLRIEGGNYELCGEHHGHCNHWQECPKRVTNAFEPMRCQRRNKGGQADENCITRK